MTILLTDTQKCASEISYVETGNLSLNKKCLSLEWYSYDKMSLDVQLFKYSSQLKKEKSSLSMKVSTLCLQNSNRD